MPARQQLQSPRRRAAARVLLAGVTVLTVAVPAGAAERPEAVGASLQADREFRQAVDRELPGVFQPERPGVVPLAFFGRTTCGALRYAGEAELRDGTALTADEVVERWARDLGAHDARKFVAISVEFFCPSLLR